MKVYLNNVDITEYISTVNWSGADTQVSRSLDISVASNPYDKQFKSPKIVNGDIIKFTDDKETYMGVVTRTQKTTDIGTITYNTKDFMHYLLRGSYSHKFKNATAEAITRKVCKDIGVDVGKLAITKIHLAKTICDGVPPYNAIVKAYNKVSRKYKYYYMPVMEGKKLSVITKWQDCGVEINDNITSGEYSQDTENMVNQVVIKDEKGKKIGIVKDNQSINRYGTYQDEYTKEKGVNAKTAAKNIMQGQNEEIKVESVTGDVRAKAGWMIKVKDKATGIKGKYCIVSDTHTWENGIHTMTLELRKKREREEL